MPQSHSNVLLHIVFSTKNRSAYLRSGDVREALNAYMVGRFQHGYGAFSVSQSNVESVKAYIANQEEHTRE